MKLNYLFDFFVYRITKLYEKPDKGETFRGALIVGATQAIIILDLILYPLRIFYSRQEISLYSNSFKSVAAVIVIGLMVFNFLRYKDRYTELREKFHGSHLENLHIVVVFFVLSIPWIAIMFLGR